MRALHRPPRRDTGARRRAVAGITISALLALSLGQSLHAASAGDVERTDPASRAFVAAHDTSSPPAPHGADLCPVCRATAQARLAVRAFACAGEIASTGASLRLHLPAPAQAGTGRQDGVGETT